MRTTKQQKMCPCVAEDKPEKGHDENADAGMPGYSGQIMSEWKIKPHINSMQWAKIIECISHKSLKNTMPVRENERAREKKEWLFEDGLWQMNMPGQLYTYFNIIQFHTI